VPTARADRALAPDVARGLVLLGIAVANVPFFLYRREVGILLKPMTDAAADPWVNALVATLADNRSYSFFALLFFGDILGTYGLLGLALVLLIRASGRTLAIVGWLAFGFLVLVATQIVVITWFGTLVIANVLAALDRSGPAEWLLRRAVYGRSRSRSATSSAGG
jgi:uncharacterized membrane protein YeiB